MADISMTKPDEVNNITAHIKMLFNNSFFLKNFKIPNPPDLSPLPPPYTPTAQKVHKLLSSALQLFPVQEKKPMLDEPDMSPYPQRQQFQLQQQQTMMMRQQQLNNNSSNNNGISSVGSINSSSSSPHHLHHALLKNNPNVDMQQDISGMNPFMNEEMLSMIYQQHPI